MFRNLFPIILITFLVIGNISDTDAQQPPAGLTMDPDEAQFVLDDVQNFIRAYDMFREGGDTLATLQKEYFDRGTPGLKMFVEKYGLTAEKLVGAIRNHPEKYGTLHDMPGLLTAYSGESRLAFAKLKNYIPGVVYPPTFFLVGAYRGIGSGSAVGQLITVEKWKKPIEDKTTLLVHELVHFQQAMAVGPEKYVALFGPEKNLLGLCIREGTAEFFANLVTGKITQDDALDYTLKNEKRLWEWFVKEMDGSETGDWMWTKPSDPEQPSHIGYVIGSRIVEAYYRNAEDKEAAVSEILSSTDHPGFLAKSRYAERFAE